MKEETLIEILVVCLIVSVICNIIGAGILAERLAFNQKQEEMEQMNKDYWDEWAKQQSYDRAFSEWGEFECTFNNETLILETECGGHGYITITIFSNPKVNISLGHFDKYRTMEKWELYDDDNILIEDTEENVIIIQRERVFKKEYPTQFLKSIANSSSWYFYAPYGSKTVSAINIPDNASSNLTIIVRKDVSQYSYMDDIYTFLPVFHVFEVKI